VKVDRAQSISRKKREISSLKNLKKYQKIKDILFYLIFETNLKKSSQKKIRIKNKKKLLQNYTPCLDSQCIKIGGNSLNLI